MDKQSGDFRSRSRRALLEIQAILERECLVLMPSEIDSSLRPRLCMLVQDRPGSLQHGAAIWRQVDTLGEVGALANLDENKERTATEAVLKELADGPRSPLDLEAHPPAALPREAVRIAVQTLLDEGVVVLDDSLKLSVAQKK